MKSEAAQPYSPVEVMLADQQSDIRLAGELVRKAIAAVGAASSARVEELRGLADQLEKHAEDLLWVGIDLWVPAEDRHYFHDEES
ncbi:Uncharacterised protein [Mycobacteroides abscessus subsp. abscessus]|uniref:hypothetical protein n=1 Tax=Mycobacteroides abscessus TaxID=36809 RepID=UPI000929D4CB|nr:hypothetical protein [Mycobacteroides abscessus]SHU65589.1 Uncharacterised protein [Mycobacteroides abscessus subsp. abscessus]